MNERNAEKIDCVDDIFDCEIPVVDCPIKRENELLLIQKKEACEAWEVWARSLIQERDAAREEGTRLEAENRQLKERLRIGPYGDDEIDALQAIIEEREREAESHKQSCAEALQRSLEATQECLRLERENKRLLDLLEEAREEIQNCYGRDIPLTERIWQTIEGCGE